MTWTKLSDDFADEAWTLSDAGFRLLVESLNYSNKKLLDLRIPKDELRRFAKKPEAADELVKGGWWNDAGSHYIVVFNGAYQPTREAVVKQIEANRANGAKGGRPAKPGRERAPKTHSQSHSLSDSKTHLDGTGRADYGSAVLKEIPETKGDVGNVSTGEVRETGRCLVPGCGNKLVSPEALSAGLCRKGDEAHAAARATPVTDTGRFWTVAPIGEGRLAS